MKFTVISLKQCALANVNALLNCDQLNSIDLLKILIMKGILLQNVAWKKITMLKS